MASPALHSERQLEEARGLDRQPRRPLSSSTWMVRNKIVQITQQR